MHTSTIAPALGHNRAPDSDTTLSPWFATTNAATGSDDSDDDEHVSMHTTGPEARAVLAHTDQEDPLGLLVAALTMTTISQTSRDHLVKLAMREQATRLLKALDLPVELFEPTAADRLDLSVPA